MKTYITELQAIDPKDGELKKWGGVNIEANSIEEAQNKCNEMEMGYLTVVAPLDVTIPDNSLELEKGWENKILARLRPII